MLLQTTGLSPPNIVLSLASIEDTDEIVDHFHNNFYLREPLTNALMKVLMNM